MNRFSILPAAFPWNLITNGVEEVRGKDRCVQAFTFLRILTILFCGAFLLPAQNLTIPPPPSPTREAVFILVFEAKGAENDMSSSSKVEVRLAPGPVWHGTFGAYRIGGIGGSQDARTPAALYQLRGGLAGLRVGERMCFGVASHKGVAHASDGATVNQPLEGQGHVDWQLEGDAARFERTKEGGVLTCTPMVYSGESPSYGLLGPGVYDYAGGGNALYQELIRFRFTTEELLALDRVVKVNEASLQSREGGAQQHFKTTLIGAPPADEAEVIVEPEESYLGGSPKATWTSPRSPATTRSRSPSPCARRATRRSFGRPI